MSQGKAFGKMPKNADGIRLFGQEKTGAFWVKFWIAPKVENLTLAKIRDINQGKTTL